MSTEKEELVEAYEKQEMLYGKIHDLVKKQIDVVNGRAGPHRVLELCRSVEELLGEISDIEDRIGPVKKRWMKNDRELPQEVDAILSRIQSLIGHISDMQEEVRQHLRRCARQEAVPPQNAVGESGEAAYRDV